MTITDGAELLTRAVVGVMIERVKGRVQKHQPEDQERYL